MICTQARGGEGVEIPFLALKVNNWDHFEVIFGWSLFLLGGGGGGREEVGKFWQQLILGF